MQNCPTDEEIRSFAHGAAPADTATRLQAHLRGCARCRDLLARDADPTRPSSAALMAETMVIPPAAGSSMLETQIVSPGSAPAGDPAETVAVQMGRSGTAQGERGWSLDAHAQSPTPQREYLPTIEGYDIKRVLGRGGMGVVYEAIQLKLKRRVALKLLPAIIGSQHPELVQRFQREATAAARLHHSNIIPIYDYGESRDGYYYAMELILGESLASVIRRLAAVDTPLTARTAVSLSLGSDVMDALGESTQPTERQIVSLGAGGVPYYRQVAQWTASIADALDYAHKHGLIHRDIKPGNIMLAADGRVVILDFGLVKMDDDASVTVSGSTIGTFRYISPEQISSKSALDGRVDQYALGVTLYELLVLRPAFPELDQRTLLHAVMHREPTAPRKVMPAVPRELEVVCRKAMEKAAKDRYASCADMAADLRRYLMDIPIQARPDGPIRRSVKFVKRHRAASLTALTAVLLATSVAFGAWQQQKAHRLRLDALVRDAVTAWQQRKWITAEEKFQQVLADDPRNFGALVNFAAARKDQYFADPRPELLAEAGTLLDRALRDQPMRPEIWNFQGVILREQGKLPEALAAHEKAAQLEPRHNVTWVNLATVRAMLGDLEQAEQEILKGIELGAGQLGPKAWYNLAAVQLQLAHSGAAESLLAAIDHSPEKVDDLWRPAPYLLRARLMLSRHEPDDLADAQRAAVVADELCGTIARRKPANLLERLVLARSKRCLALAELRAGHWQQALTAAESARQFGDLAVCPELIAAIARAKLGEPEVAKVHYAQALANWPAELKTAAYLVRAEGGMLWFENAAELESLRAAAAAGVGLTESK